MHVRNGLYKHSLLEIISPVTGSLCKLSAPSAAGCATGAASAMIAEFIVVAEWGSGVDEGLIAGQLELFGVKIPSVVSQPRLYGGA